MTSEDYARQLATLQNAVGRFAKAQSVVRGNWRQGSFEGDARQLGILGWSWLHLPANEAAAIERCGFGNGDSA